MQNGLATAEAAPRRAKVQRSAYPSVGTTSVRRQDGHDPIRKQRAGAFREERAAGDYCTGLSEGER